MGVDLSASERCTFGYEARDEDGAGGKNDGTGPFLGVGLYAPLLIHPAPHAFVGLGPTVSHDLKHPINQVDNLATKLGMGPRRRGMD